MQNIVTNPMTTKFNRSTSRAALAIKRSKKCIRNWEKTIAQNIMSPIVGLAWLMIWQHNNAICHEKRFMKQVQQG